MYDSIDSMLLLRWLEPEERLGNGVHDGVATMGAKFVPMSGTLVHDKGVQVWIGSESIESSVIAFSKSSNETYTSTGLPISSSNHHQGRLNQCQRTCNANFCSVCGQEDRNPHPPILLMPYATMLDCYNSKPSWYRRLR